MQYHIITVGSELTLGLSVNTNAAFIAKRLGREGFTCNCQVSVPDNLHLIAKAIRESLVDAHGVIVTGGLGPTADDITREAICKAAGCELEYQPHLAEVIKERFGTRYYPLPEMAFRQAYLPSGATAIEPAIGSAPGILLEKGGKYIIALPGVPREMEAMIEHDVIPWLTSKFSDNEYYRLRVLRTTARSESSLQERVEDLMTASPDISVGIIASPGEIQLQLLAKGTDENAVSDALNKAEATFIERLGTIVFGFDDQTLEEVVGDLLKKHGLKLALAESCTGGLASKKVTDIPGSSEYFLGGIVTYSNEAKEALLNVPNQTILEHGAVSAATALAMAEGARKKLGADIGLSITGIAGPSGGTADKPVGLIYIGLSHETTSFANKFVFFGSRDIIRLKSANAALDMLRYFILDGFEQRAGDR